MNTDTDRNNHTSNVSWLALLLATLALILGGMAYNRSGKDLNDLVKETTNKTVAEARLIGTTGAVGMPTVRINMGENSEYAKAKIDLEAKLIGLKARVALNKADEAAAKEVAMMRAEYSKVFANADSEAKATAQVMDSKLNQLETDLRAGTANTLLSLESAIENLRDNVTE